MKQINLSSTTPRFQNLNNIKISYHIWWYFLEFLFDGTLQTGCASKGQNTEHELAT